MVPCERSCHKENTCAVPYIRKFSHWFNFSRVRDLFQIAKNAHSENKTLQLVYIDNSLKVKIGLSEQLTHLPVIILAKIARCENIPIYGMKALSLLVRKL